MSGIFALGFLVGFATYGVTNALSDYFRRRADRKAER